MKFLYPYQTKGELYIEKVGTSSKTVGFHCIYSINPYNNIEDIFLLHSEENPEHTLKQLYSSCDNFQDFINFLNYDETNLIKEFKELYAHIITKISNTDIQENHTILKLIDNVKTELIKWHPYFRHDTNYHIYDFILYYFLVSLKALQYDIFDENNTIYNTDKDCVYNFQHIAYDLIIDEPVWDTEFFENVYESSLLFLKHPYYKYDILENPFLEISKIRTFIIENMPDTIFSITSSKWQHFLHQLSTEYEQASRVAPYTLTNHVKHKYFSLLKHAPSTPTRDIFIKMNEAFCPSRKNIHHPKRMENKNFDNAFLETAKEATDTYIIKSFENYIVAEILELLKNGISLKFCNYCGCYYLKHKYIYHHLLSCPKKDDDNAKTILRLYNNKMKFEKKTYEDIYLELLYTPKIDVETLEDYWLDFTKQQQLSFQKALRFAQPHNKYKTIIDSSHFKNFLMDKEPELF